jgi:hypothetical protein
MKKMIFTSLFTVLTFYVYAQKAPIKYGKPTMEQMTKSVYEIDSTAPAIVLCNYGQFDNNQFLFSQTIRIKILKKEGYKWANRSFTTGSSTTVRGKTFNLVNGKIVADKLTSKSIFRQEVIKNRLYVTKISMPNVKVGSVIDIEISYPWLPMAWYFQETVPVLYSELLLEKNQYIDFTKNSFGYVGFNIIEPGRWVAKNVPAFQEEPFMAPVNNYLAHFEFDISGISIPGRVYEAFAGSWADINETLGESKYFGGALRGSGSFFSSMAKSINSNYDKDEDKLKAAVDTIHFIHWNGNDRLYTTNDLGLSHYYNRGKGNSADINLSLIRLLGKIGFEVHPVVLRTRDKGRLSTFNPTLNNLNYVVAYVKLNDKYILVDATDKMAPYYILPDRCLNEQGRLVSNVNSRWVPLTNNIKYQKQAFYILNLNSDDLSLKGTVTNFYRGYAAYHFRKDYEEGGTNDNYLDKLTHSIEGLKVIKDTLLNLKDVYRPVKEKATVELQNQCFASDSLVYINLLPGRLTENPFKQEKRKYPIDFVYRKGYRTTVILTVPDNYQAVTIPSPTRMILPDNGATFTYMIQQSGNRLTLISNLKLNKSFYTQKEYALLKTFYQKVIEKENEPIVFKATFITVPLNSKIVL